MALRFLAVLLAGACVCGCRGTSPPPALDNGIYEVLAAAPDPARLPAPDADTRVLVFDRQFVRGGSEIPPEHVLVRIPGHAPLDLARKPEVTGGKESPRLNLQLRPAAADALTKLTTRARRAAVIIDGKVVSVHGIKVPIEGGALQVSC